MSDKSYYVRHIHREARTKISQYSVKSKRFRLDQNIMEYLVVELWVYFVHRPHDFRERTFLMIAIIDIDLGF